ncbi:MAG: TIGR01459 family HAD-type hydrolase [Paracoccaceae bacterium]
MMEPVTLDDLLSRYDAFLIDQFGVLLDGSSAYPKAAEALAHLARAGRRVILLSNSGKRSGPNAERLYRLGFAPGSFELVLSSGEAAFRWLTEQRLAAGTKVWLHARDGDESAVEGLGLTQVDRPAEAALLILAGSRADVFGLSEYEAWLRPAAAEGVPMLCSNPDMWMLTPIGQRPGAGRIARLYQDLGGKVDWVGKPYPLIYRLARQLLDGIPPDRILCIGDSPAHDIRGGAEAGLRTALVRTGLHADTADAGLARLCQDEAGVLPDHILPRFAL